MYFGIERIADGPCRLLAYDEKTSFAVYLRQIVRDSRRDALRHEHGRLRPVAGEGEVGLTVSAGFAG